MLLSGTLLATMVLLYSNLIESALGFVKENKLSKLKSIWMKRRNKISLNFGVIVFATGIVILGTVFKVPSKDIKYSYEFSIAATYVPTRER